MNNRIKNKSDLPEWFFLTDYEVIKQFNLSDWYSAFLYRKNTQWLLDNYKEYKHSKIKQDQSMKVNDFYIEKITNLMTESRQQFNKVKSRTPSHKINPDIESISSKSPLRLYSTCSLIEFNSTERKNNELKAINNIKKSPAPETKHLKNAYYEIIKKEIELFKYKINEGIAYLEIDTYASDSQLKDDFERWLVKYRKRNSLGKIPDITESKIKSWNDYKILKYIDLMQWQELYETKINKAFLSSVLYPDEEYVNPSRIDTTLPDLMKKVLSWKHLKTLKIRANI